MSRRPSSVRLTLPTRADRPSPPPPLPLPCPSLILSTSLSLARRFARSDALLEAGTAGLYNKVKGIPKGIAFPTSLSINSTLQNFSPLPSDPTAATVLVANDVVKIALGAHIDGHAVVSAET